MDLPIWKHREEICSALQHHPTLIIMGETGSGKTTRMHSCKTNILEVPQLILQKTPNARIAITQPRRVAAISLAKRVAEEMQVQVSKEVGYSVRFEEASSPATRIKFLTDGMLLREVMSDPLLKRYSVIILDEVHERSVRTDILLGLCKEAQKQRKGDLKLIIMSATLDPKPFLAYLPESKLFQVPGRQFPVQLFYTAEPQADYLDATVLTIFQLHQELQKEGGDFLVFLTGQEEIEAVSKLLDEHGPKCRSKLRMLVCPLFASLSAQQQLAAFKPTPSGLRKIVLATNVAETSITIPGIRTVIDPGFVKQRSWNPRSGIDALLVKPTSQASCRQRTGRAGRDAPGQCYRLFPEEAFKTLEVETPPEILRTNLASLLLTMKAAGIDNVLSFDFLDAPDRNSLASGLEELLALGALSSTGKLTTQGRLMAECPLPPTLSRSLLEAQRLGCVQEMLSIVSLLSVDNLLLSTQGQDDENQVVKRPFQHRSGDHLTLLSIYEAYQAKLQQAPLAIDRWCRENLIDSRSMRTCLQIRSQLEAFCQHHKIPLSTCAGDPTPILKALTAGHFRQAAMRSADSDLKTVLGRQSVSIHPSSALHSQARFLDCVIYHELTLTSRCYLRTVSRIEASWIAEYLEASK